MAEAHVVTPGGYRHPSLVHRVEAGTVVDRTAGRLRLVHRSGRVLREFGVLQRSREGVPVMPANVVPIPPGDAVTAPVPGLASGWITYSTWTNPDAGNPISRFSTTWVVPPEPSSDDGQTVFLFNGIQNGSMIYQPVLQWGSSGAGGGDNWAVASWYADGQGGPAFHTDLVSVNPGDVLVGVMTLTGQSDLIALQQNVGGVGTSVGPALANFNGLLYMAWKGIEGDDGIWWSTFDGANWAPQQNVGGVGTSVGPTLAVNEGDQPLLYMAWKGIEGDDGIWWSTFDGANWAPQQNVGGVGTSVGPALASFNGVLYMVWKGIEGDDGIWWSTFDGANWAPQQNIGGVGTSFRPALAVYDAKLYMAWKGIEGDDGIWWSSFDGANWAPQQNVGGVGTSAGLGIAPDFDGFLDMAWKGIEGDDGIWWSRFDGTNWV